MTPGWVSKLEDLAEHLIGDLDSKHWPDSKIVHDTVWGTQSFAGWEVALMDLPLVERLRSIHQTSLAYLTFPTALHTRFDHSLGVCSGTKQLAARVLGLQPNGEEWNRLSAAAILHDVGHGPFSHLSEDTYAINPELFAGLNYPSDISYDESKSEDPMSPPFPRGAAHEVIGALLLRTGPASALFERLADKYGVALDGRDLGEIITGNRSQDFASAMLVNGPFDADKIDYLRRDSLFSGVPIALDVDRLIHSLDVLPNPETGKPKVAVQI